MTTLPPGVYLRENSYYVRFKRQGKWKHRSAGAHLADAIELAEQLRNGKTYAPDVVRFQQIVERYRKRLDTYSKPRTIQNYRNVSARLVKSFRNRPVESLTPADLEAFIQHRLETVAPVTVNNELRNLRAILRLAVEEKLILELPFKIRMLKETKRRTAKVFTREEIQRLLDAADDRMRVLLLIACSTGMRVGEIRHLQWQDVDSAQRRISVRAKADWTPKTHHERACYVPQSVIDDLAAYRRTLKHNADTDWVFQNRRVPGKRWGGDGSSYIGIRDTFKRAGLYQKGKLTHEIRRAVASTMLLNGTPIHVVKEILGHSTIKTTELYAFTTEEAKREASTRGIL